MGKSLFSNWICRKLLVGIDRKTSGNCYLKYARKLTEIVIWNSQENFRKLLVGIHRKIKGIVIWNMQENFGKLLVGIHRKTSGNC